jgi:hypothetical protein
MQVTGTIWAEIGLDFEGVTIDSNVERLLSNLTAAFADELQDAAVAEAAE